MRAYPWQGDIVLRFTPEEAMGFVHILRDMQEAQYHGRLRKLMHWLKSALPGVVERLRTVLEPYPAAIAKKEEAAVEEDKRRKGNG